MPKKTKRSKPAKFISLHDPVRGSTKLWSHNRFPNREGAGKLCSEAAVWVTAQSTVTGSVTLNQKKEQFLADTSSFIQKVMPCFITSDLFE